MFLSVRSRGKASTVCNMTERSIHLWHAHSFHPNCLKSTSRGTLCKCVWRRLKDGWHLPATQCPGRGPVFPPLASELALPCFDQQRMEGKRAQPCEGSQGACTGRGGACCHRPGVSPTGVCCPYSPGGGLGSQRTGARALKRALPLSLPHSCSIMGA